jgi:hypothetical protein
MSIGIRLAGLVATAGPDRDHLALLGLFLGAVRDDDAALGLLLGVDTFDHDAVMQRTKFGFSHSGSFCGLGFQVWFVSESGSEHGRIQHRRRLAWGRTVRIRSNRALGVLIRGSGIWLDAGPVKQGGLSPW